MGEPPVWASRVDLLGADGPDSADVEHLAVRTDSYADFDALIEERRRSAAFEVVVDDGAVLLLRRR